MLILKAIHIIAMVAWFAGLFYLPRLFVYHAEAKDNISLQRFQIMEWRLYYAIMWPAAIVTIICGLAILYPYSKYYLHTWWMITKLILVILLCIYHLLCGYFMRRMLSGLAPYSSLFYRIWNEVPTLVLIAIVSLVVIKP